MENKINKICKIAIIVMSAIIAILLILGIVVAATSSVPSLKPAAYEQQTATDTDDEDSSSEDVTVEQNMGAFSVTGKDTAPVEQGQPAATGDAVTAES